MAALTTLALTIVILILILISVSAQKENITVGSTLIPSQDSKWVSPNGQFAFGFYELTTNLYVLGIWFDKIPSKTLVWTVIKDKSDLPVEKMSSLQLTNNGLSLYDASKTVKWSAAPSDEVVAAAMLDSGNFVLLNASHSPIWKSFDYPTDTLLPSQELKWNSTMYSRTSDTNLSSGRFELTLQEDSNLVLYPVERVGESQGAYWPPKKLVGEVLKFNSSGVLQLVNTSSMTVSTLTEGKAGDGQFLRRVTLETDGILAQYVWNLDDNDSSWRAIWKAVNDPCMDVKGQCGRNGICQLNNTTKPDCRCPWQFSFIDSQDHFKGCKREELTCSAPSKMQRLDHTDWLNGNDYSVLAGVTERECMEACINDCMCTVVTYGLNTLCWKKQMPLIDGRIGMDITNIAFVKVYDDFKADSPISAPAPPPPPEGKAIVASQTGIILVACSSSILMIAFLVVCLGGLKLHKMRKIAPQIMVLEGLKAFSYREIEAATAGFREELGRGSFGKVCKGRLEDGREIAVKILDEKAVQEKHGEREFRTEMSVIGRSHHKNLVQLYGFCDQGSHRHLVYEYMPNGSLDTFLFVDCGFLDWRTRMNIAMGTARGLLYLHEECRTQTIHCDIKPQNILLDQNFNPKISDFGLAKLLRVEQTATHTIARGTRGYIAPEWMNNMPITVKVDIYSFGVMLLEIICCRKTMKLDAPENEILLDVWVYECFKSGTLAQLVEQQRVEGEEGMGIGWTQLERMVLVGLWCIQEDPALRPSTKKVVQMMEGTVEIAVPPPPGSFVGSLSV